MTYAQAEQYFAEQGFSLCRKRSGRGGRGGYWPVFWTTPDGKQYHANITELDPTKLIARIAQSGLSPVVECEATQ